MEKIPYSGEIMALAAALSWSFAVILFRKTGETVPALALNIFKTLFSLILFTLTLVVMGADFLPPLPRREYLIFLISGGIGIGLADTFFFMTLNRVGAGLQSIITTSYSPSIILFSILFLDERLTLVQFAGVVLILSAVLFVSKMGGRKNELSRRTLVIGTVFGISAMIFTAISVVMVKPLLSGHSLIWVNWWRLLGGSVVGLLLLPLLPRRRQAIASLRNVRVWPVMIPGSFIGNYISLILWLGGMKYTQVSNASVLNQTSTIWTFLLAALLLKEPVTWKRLLGLALGLGGVALVTFG
ncbi:MAG: DMT family transporter [Candidatus Eisenbacteria bacterium]|uniref:DMT family transporter n=1 Tax=Eiseniibacteriota bacterium TaxID=2212470 RepID=A0A948RT45_UNCEI|nr:DMT family transporter [Candidatus Eisenbacteria bacterium]MBU1950760.1 DMT family transporter [Candidatus Eisenbacteria bacterium]MBU2690081.1 DMT family transporter [Candidatus Eisenbacteria bacterium]